MTHSRFLTSAFSLLLLSVLVALPLVARSDDSALKSPTLPEKSQLHLYLLIGQSNMAGRGTIEAPDKIATPRVLKFTKENSWVPALDPLHFDKSVAGVGLGTTFGKVMAEADPQVTIGLVPCAVGGTPLSRWQKDGDLYKQAVVRIKAAMKDGTLKGVLWHQGESDSGSQTTAQNYGERLAQMVKDLRTELDAPDVPFVAGKLGEFLKRDSKPGQPSYWPVVNEQLDMLPSRVSAAAVVSSQDLKHKGDVVHFDAASLREFGKRYAAAMQKLQAATR